MAVPCSQCLTITKTPNKGRCPPCAARNEQTRRPPATERYPPEYRQHRRRLLANRPPCHWCGKPNANTADHLTPISKGGTHNLNNLVASCARCNSSRGNRT